MIGPGDYEYFPVTSHLDPRCCDCGECEWCEEDRENAIRKENDEAAYAREEAREFYRNY